MTAIPASYEMSSGGFPSGLDFDPAAPQSRLTVFFRILMAIPSLICLEIIGIVTGIVTFIAWLAILFTGKYPAGMMGLAQGFIRWWARLMGYMYLLTGKYPPFSMGEDNAYPIRAHVSGETDNRNRLTVFFRLIMMIPHAIILGVLGYVVGVVVFISWVAALFTGSVPGGLHNFVGGYMRWYVRYATYALLLTDQYPPFGMS